MKSLEMIQNCNSLEELVNEIKGGKSKKRNRFMRFIVNFIERLEKNTQNKMIRRLSFGVFIVLYLISAFWTGSTEAHWAAVFRRMTIGWYLFYGITEYAIQKNKKGGNFFLKNETFFHDLPIFILISLSFFLLSNLIGIVVGVMVITFSLILGLYDPDREKRSYDYLLTKNEKRAEQLNILSEWLKDQEEKIVESLKERKNSIRNLKDQLQKYLNTLESKSRDDFLRNKYGKNILAKAEIIEDQLSSVELSLKSLEEKERVMTQAIEETINNILPEFRKEQEFLQEMIEIDQVLDKANTEISETRELIRSIDQNFINMFTKVNSALEQASVMNQALIEVTNDGFKSINRISEPIESFNVGELQEVVNSTRPKVHS